MTEVEEARLVWTDEAASNELGILVDLGIDADVTVEVAFGLFDVDNCFPLEADADGTFFVELLSADVGALAELVGARLVGKVLTVDADDEGWPDDRVDDAAWDVD